jgi:5-methylthioadenosine/S-adenosylhomocysteine deaminase
MDHNRTIILDGAVTIQQERITEIDRTSNLKNKTSYDTVIDASGMIILPGLVNTHTHTPTPHLRIPDYGWKLMGGIREIYRKLSEPKRGDVIKKNSLISCLELINFGSTTIKDSYDMAPSLAEAIMETGLRGVVSELISEVDVTKIAYDIWEFRPEDAERKLEKSLQFIEKWEGKADGRITTQLSPQAPDMVRENLMHKFLEKSKQYGKKLSIHAAQSEREVRQVKKLYKKTPIKHLNDIGMLGPDTLLAHCIYTSDEDTQIIKESNSKIMHCPISQTTRGGILAPVIDWVKNQIPVGLGTDNINHDMFTAMRRMMMISEANKKGMKYHSSYGKFTLTPYDTLETATFGGAKILGMDDEIGSLEIGKKADIITINIKKPHLMPILDPINNLVRYAKGSDVNHVIINGKVIKDEKGITTVNEKKILEEGQETANHIICSFFDVHPELDRPKYLGKY